MGEIENKFLNFIKQPEFSCIGAKAAAKKNQISIMIARDLTSDVDDTHILNKIYQFIKEWKQEKEVLQTLVVIFQGPLASSELEFESKMWSRLQNLHNLDSQIFMWDKTISSDVTNSNFSFSLGGYGFFIVGLHAKSSRKARQFEYPP